MTERGRDGLWRERNSGRTECSFWGFFTGRVLAVSKIGAELFEWVSVKPCERVSEQVEIMIKKRRDGKKMKKRKTLDYHPNINADQRKLWEMDDEALFHIAEISLADAAAAAAARFVNVRRVPFPRDHSVLSIHRLLASFYLRA